MGEKRYIKKPSLYEYHDYRLYLKDWLRYKKMSEPDFSLRKLGQRCGIAIGYLPMVIKGSRTLSSKSVEKLKAELRLSPPELKYFLCLRTLSDSTSQNERLSALKGMQRYKKYKKKNTDEAVVYRYLSKWIHVALRELTLVNNAKFDSYSIQKLFIEKLSIKEINAAMQFLLENHFVSQQEDGSINPQQERLHCESQVHKLGLTEFHKHMFQLAVRAIDTIPSAERWITGYTFPLNKEQFEQVKKILIEAKEKVAQIPSSKTKNNTVYHTAFVAFPLTKTVGENND